MKVLMLQGFTSRIPSKTLFKINLFLSLESKCGLSVLRVTSQAQPGWSHRPAPAGFAVSPRGGGLGLPVASVWEPESRSEPVRRVTGVFADNVQKDGVIISARPREEGTWSRALKGEGTPVLGAASGRPERDSAGLARMRAVRPRRGLPWSAQETGQVARPTAGPRSLLQPAGPSSSDATNPSGSQADGAQLGISSQASRPEARLGENAQRASSARRPAPRAPPHRLCVRGGGSSWASAAASAPTWETRRSALKAQRPSPGTGDNTGVPTPGYCRFQTVSPDPEWEGTVRMRSGARLRGEPPGRTCH